MGYIGSDNAVDVILDGLSRLEYRGYDSAGIAVIDEDRIRMEKGEGKLRHLRKLFLETLPSSSAGIGHTRWATHGRPSRDNAHPHTDCTGRIALVHNGIIENFHRLRNDLIEKGHRFTSETDSEVLAHLLEEELSRGGCSFVEALQRMMLAVEGAFAVAVLFSEEPERLYVCRRFSPLVVGVGESENFVASDVPAILSYTRDVVYLEDDQLCVLSRDGVEVLDMRGERVQAVPQRIEWSPLMAERGGYPHFMLKEIHEQPEVFRSTVGGRFDEETDEVYLEELGLDDDRLCSVRRVVFVACGTAYYAGMVGSYVLPVVGGVPAEAHLASEFRYREGVLSDDTLVVAVSQSGETADTLAAMRRAKEHGCPVVGILNVKGSTMEREVDGVIHINAGPEIGVASTKAYTGMLGAVHLLSLCFSKALHGECVEYRAMRKRVMEGLRHLPAAMERALEQEEHVREIAYRYSEASDFLYLGRGPDYPTALEGALKMKEISYIHAEGYAAGEMKHGPIALVEHGFPVVAVVTRSRVYDKMVNAVKEVKARDARVIAVACEGDTLLPSICDDVVSVPQQDELLAPIVNVIPLQLMAYYVADYRGVDIDQPRNLAKSVTVE